MDEYTCELYDFLTKIYRQGGSFRGTEDLNEAFRLLYVHKAVKVVRLWADPPVTQENP